MEEPRILVVSSNRRNEGETTSAFSYSGIHEQHFNGHLQNSSSGAEDRLPSDYVVKRYLKVKTVWTTVLSLTVEALLVAVVIQLRWYCSRERTCGVSPSSISIYLNCTVWLFTLLIHRYVRHHRDYLRRHGYSEFYHKTKTTSTVPALVFSSGNFLLLLYLTILHDTKCDKGCNLGLDRFAWIQILICLEVLLAFPHLFLYLVHSLQFNKCRQTPDIFRESPLDQDNLSVRRDVGFRSQTLVEELLEKQSDAISYLKLRCEDLTRTIFNLTQQRTRYSSADDLQGSFSTSETQQLVQ